MSESSTRRGVRAYHLLAALPALCLLGGIPFANRVEPLVLGLPFLLFWIVAWVVATSAIMGVIWMLDHRGGAQ
ncbi:MAG TPA: DUF3311 domain-containing protein [Gemmatimonadaceae bacterium]|nr:DUF3311 domain-containing protein [Gemmatimonadaceae bacterium]